MHIAAIGVTVNFINESRHHRLIPGARPRYAKKIKRTFSQVLLE